MIWHVPQKKGLVKNQQKHLGGVKEVPPQELLKHEKTKNEIWLEN